MTPIRNLLLTLMLKNLYAASVPAKAANVPITAWITMPWPYWYSNNLLKAPSATPSSAAKASTRAGLITRLNELTIDSPKAPRPPMVIADVELVDLGLRHGVAGGRGRHHPGRERRDQHDEQREAGLLHDAVDRHRARATARCGSASRCSTWTGRTGAVAGVRRAASAVDLVAVGVGRCPVELVGVAEDGVVALHGLLLGGRRGRRSDGPLASILPIARTRNRSGAGPPPDGRAVGARC